MKATQAHRRKAGPRAPSTTEPARGSAAGRPVTWRDTLSYKTDEILSRGTLGIIVWLAAMTLMVVVVAAVALAVLRLRFNDGTDEGFFEAAWQSLLRVIDPGTMGGDAGWPARATGIAAARFWT